MPKIVDHAARRAELAAAVWRLVGRAGIQAATVRAVADESGWSMGAVRHYFASHDELLSFAVQEMAARIRARVVALYERPLAGPQDRFDRACRALEHLLPLDADRRVEAVVWLAYMTRARVDPRLDDIRWNGWAGERYICRLALADAADRPLPADLDTRLDPDLEAHLQRVHLVVDGVSLQAATYPEHWPPARLTDAVRESLEPVRAPR